MRFCDTRMSGFTASQMSERKFREFDARDNEEKVVILQSIS